MHSPMHTSKRNKDQTLISPNMMPSFSFPLHVQCGGLRFSTRLAPAPQDFSTSEAFSPRTVLTENICRCVQHKLQHLPTTMPFLTTSTICLSCLASAPSPGWLLVTRTRGAWWCRYRGHWRSGPRHPSPRSTVCAQEWHCKDIYWGVFLIHPVLALISSAGHSLTHPILALLLSGEFLWYIPCWLHFHLGGFSYTSYDAFVFIWGVSLKHPILHLPFCGEFLLHIPCCLLFQNLGSFSYTSHDGFIFIWGVFLTHPVLASLLSGEFLLHIPCWLYFSLGSLFFLWGVSLTHPVLASLLSGEFLLHIPCRIYFSVGSFSYTSHAGFFF